MSLVFNRLAIKNGPYTYQDPFTNGIISYTCLTICSPGL